MRVVSLRMLTRPSGGTSSRTGGRRTATTTHVVLSGQRRQQSTVVSRRQWMEYMEKAHPRLKVPREKPKTDASQKPWPRSVIMTGYAVAGTVIPYTLVWIGLTNESTRPWILRHCNETVEQRLREHFGEPDMSQVSYVDQNESNNQDGGTTTTTAIPHSLLGELPQTMRLQQRRIDQIHTQSLKTRIKLRHVGSDTVLGEYQVELPATTKASQAELVTRVPASATMDQSGLRPSSALMVDFPIGDKSPTLINSDNEVSFDDHTTETTESPAVDPLRIDGRVYSLWHYQPAAPEITTDTSKSRMEMSKNEIEVARLQHRIAILEEELKNSTVATRPIDDITEELATSKGKLRRLQWKKWLPWM